MMIISVDHGNSSVKTPHFAFTSGLVVSDGPTGFSNDCVSYAGKYYALSRSNASHITEIRPKIVFLS